MVFPRLHPNRHPVNLGLTLHLQSDERAEDPADRNFDMLLQDENLPCQIIRRDQDTKYVKSFDGVFIGEDRKIKETTARSPNPQEFVERFVLTLKHNVPMVLLFGERAAPRPHPAGRDGLAQSSARSFVSGLSPAGARRGRVAGRGPHDAQALLPQQAWWESEVASGRGQNSLTD